MYHFHKQSCRSSRIRWRILLFVFLLRFHCHPALTFHPHLLLLGHLVFPILIGCSLLACQCMCGGWVRVCVCVCIFLITICRSLLNKGDSFQKITKGSWIKTQIPRFSYSKFPTSGSPHSAALPTAWGHSNPCAGNRPKLGMWEITLEHVASYYFSLHPQKTQCKPKERKKDSGSNPSSNKRAACTMCNASNRFLLQCQKKCGSPLYTTKTPPQKSWVIKRRLLCSCRRSRRRIRNLTSAWQVVAWTLRYVEKTYHWQIRPRHPWKHSLGSLGLNRWVLLLPAGVAINLEQNKG